MRQIGNLCVFYGIAPGLDPSHNKVFQLCIEKLSMVFAAKTRVLKQFISGRSAVPFFAQKPCLPGLPAV
jgi:hypothetical protein